MNDLLANLISWVIVTIYASSSFILNLIFSKLVKKYNNKNIEKHNNIEEELEKIKKSIKDINHKINNHLNEKS